MVHRCRRGERLRRFYRPFGSCATTGFGWLAVTVGVTVAFASATAQHVAAEPLTMFSAGVGAVVDSPATRGPSVQVRPVPPRPAGPAVQGIRVPALGAGTTPYAVPTNRAANWGDGHNYEAADIFVAGTCGGDVTSPVNGIIVEVRRVDNYDRRTDNPATRGGKSVALVGADGVRYYLSHFATIEPGVQPAATVRVGQRLGSVGTTGRSGGCHIHFGISPPCPNKEWSIRRGAIGPIRYLDDWARGRPTSPVAAVRRFVAAHPDACALASADRFAPDA